MLVEQRNNWREAYREGAQPPFIDDYKANRESESWRSSVTYEQMAEYILFLESQLQSDIIK